MNTLTQVKIPSHIPLAGACNARHLGGYPTPRGATRKFSFVRCEAPTGLTDGDIAKLIKLGVRTVIDLRNESEIRRDQSPFRKVPVVTLHHCPIFPDDEAIARFDGMYRGESYMWMLDEFQDAFLGAFRAILSSPDGVLFHCAAGKDRTGLLAALLLLLAGVEEETVAEEYAYSQILLAPWRKVQNAKTPDRSPQELDRIYAVRPEYMRQTIRHLHYRYGGAEGYLREIGLGPAELKALEGRIAITSAQEGLSA